MNYLYLDRIEAIYDRLGRISTVTQQGDLNTADDVREAFPWGNRVTAYTYDLVNNTTTVHRPEGVVEVTKLDSVGHVKSVTTTVKRKRLMPTILRLNSLPMMGLAMLSRLKMLVVTRLNMTMTISIA
jgi:hypothetical protein